MAAMAMDFYMGSFNPVLTTGFSPKSRKIRIFTVKCSSVSLSSDGAATGLAERPWKVADSRLVLEDGSIWRAKSFGASGTQVGEVVFNTSLTGYQEILTDPSYAGQFVLMTNPHIGNTGVNFDDEESQQCFLAGLVIRSLSISTSNWRCTETLGDYLAKRNIMGIYDVDTRAITRRLRQDGSLIGVLSTEDSKTDEELLEVSRTWDIVGVDLISGVSCKAPYEWVDKTDTEWDFNSSGRDGETFHVVAYDYGIKHNILRRLASYGCKITVVPSTWPASETLNMKPDGVFLSNGPGDPSAVPYAVESVKEIIGKVPVFGICMGHQMLGQALGGKTYKMKFGHHGGNHPVRNLRTGCVEISAQNHNYAVDKALMFWKLMQISTCQVLTNLTNDNSVGCQQIAACGGLEILSSLIAGHFPSFSSYLPPFIEIQKHGSPSKSGLEFDQQSGKHLTDEELDFLVAILGLLVNLVEKDGQNRSRLAATSISFPSLKGSEDECRDVIPLLCSIFLANQGAGEAAEEGRNLPSDDEDALLQGEKEAEKMIVEAYSALLLAFLSTESKSIRNAIAECLPDHNLAILVPVLERFVEFHLALNMISPETHTAVLEVIESCRMP